MEVVYHPSNNEFERTNTLVRKSVIQIDSTPFRQWYEQHYGITLVKKKAKAVKLETNLIQRWLFFKTFLLFLSQFRVNQKRRKNNQGM